MLDSSKVVLENNIPVNLNKGNSDLFGEITCKYFNESLEKSNFPDCLKLSNATPCFKKGTRTSKNNCRPVSILPILSKLFERLISRQLSELFESMKLETWKEAADNN